MKAVKAVVHPSGHPSLPEASTSFPTAADAIRWVDASPELPLLRRRAFKMAIGVLSRVYKRPLEAIPLNPAELSRTFLEASASACGGLTPSSLKTYRSNLRFVLYKLGLIEQSRRPASSLSPAWAALRDSLPDKYLSMWLQAFMAYCAEAGITPERVSDETLAAYFSILTTRRLMRSPTVRVRKVAIAWNRAADTVPNWPAMHIQAPVHSKNYSFPLSAYPSSYQEDVEKFRQRMSRNSADGLYTTDAPRQPSRPRTIKTRLDTIRVAAAALVHSGVPIEQITSLAVLVEISNLKKIINWHWLRAGKKINVTTGQIAETSRIIAKYHVCLTGPELAAVIAVAKAATPPQNSRMTEKNEQRLLQLEDKSAEAQLLHLPNRLMKEARALLARRQFCMAAWTAGVAVAVEIELYCPMRLENLATLRINHELVRLDSRSEHWTHLRIAADDVKNGVPITWPIEPESAQLIETYLRDFRPLLQHSGTDWLFPSRDKASGPRQPSGLSNAISDAIYKFIGIHMNTHLFRAFAGAQILEENPGALQDLRLVLGHKTLNTALRYYTSHSSKAAAKNFSKLISRKRNETRMVAAAAFEPQRRKFGRCT